MDKELTVPKWVLIVWRKIPKMPQNFSAQFVCSSPKVWDFNEKIEITYKASSKKSQPILNRYYYAPSTINESTGK